MNLTFRGFFHPTQNKQMQKLFIPLVLLISGLYSAQAMRFIYEARMIPNLAKADQVVVENVYLDLDQGHSLFRSENSVKRDSILQRMRQTRTMDPTQFRDLRSQVNYQIEKDLKEHRTIYKERIGREQYAYVEDREMLWQIQPETTKLGDYTAQKALLDFGGRQWTAWFTTEIPFADGPYKFSGLPGLIVKIEDETGEYGFDLKESKSLGVVATSSDTSRGSTISLKRTDFNKQKLKFQKDPMSFMAMSMGARSGRGGGSMDPNRQRQMQTRLKEEAENSSNTIEK